MPSEKGYPELFNNMSYWVLFEGGEPIGYTGSLLMGDFVFVGNTYIRKPYRLNGNHAFLLSERNNSPELKNLPKVTIINPIEESKMKHLVKVVQSLGYHKVESYEDVKDIMEKELYDSILNPNQQIWRID